MTKEQEMEALMKENWELHRKMSMIEKRVELIVRKGRLGFPVHDSCYLVSEDVYKMARVD